MDKKSLAQRISEHTIKVMEEKEQEAARKEAEERAKLKKEVLDILKKEVQNLGSAGKSLYTSSSDLEVLYWDWGMFDELGDDWRVKAVLKELGFELIQKIGFPDSVAFPKVDTEETEALKSLYKLSYDNWRQRELEAASNDVQGIIAKLESNQYTVRDRNKIFVNFETANRSQIYGVTVEQLMRKEGFSVAISDNGWEITVK